jgi:hypothetical protein
MVRVVVAVLVGAFLAEETQALASPGEQAISVSLNYATFRVPEHDPNGSVLGFDYERGFTDVVWLRVTGGGGAYYDDDFSYSGHATVGLTYSFDVLKYVPYANLGIGGIVLGGGGVETDVHALVELGLGVDILHSRTFSYGVQLRFESFLQETSFFTGGVRATWRWGFF